MIGGRLGRRRVRHPEFWKVGCHRNLGQLFGAAQASSARGPTGRARARLPPSLCCPAPRKAAAPSDFFASRVRPHAVSAAFIPAGCAQGDVADSLFLVREGELESALMSARAELASSSAAAALCNQQGGAPA